MAVKYIQIPFATSGNRAAVPNPTQSGGEISWNQGYGPDYQLDPDTDPDALYIERTKFNQVIFDLSSILQQWQQQAIPDWITPEANADSNDDPVPYAYSIYALVRYADKVWESLVDSNEAVPGTDATKWRDTSSPLTGVPTGTGPLPFAGTVAPDGYLMCYGQAISRTTYAALFSVIGTAYGAGDGITTFNIPDMRGRVAAGKDDMGGSAANRITSGVSGITGTQLGSAGGSQAMQQHNHGVTDPGHTHTGGDATGKNAQANAGGQVWYGTAQATGNSATGISINNEGAGNSQNVQPTLITNYIIKT